MKNEKREELALEIACRMGAVYHPNDFGDSLVETAKFYKQMTGEDLGIKDLEKTNRQVKGIKLPWYKRIFNTIN